MERLAVEHQLAREFRELRALYMEAKKEELGAQVERRLSGIVGGGGQNVQMEVAGGSMQRAFAGSALLTSLNDIALVTFDVWGEESE